MSDSRHPPRLLVKTLTVAFVTVALLLSVVFVVVTLSVRNQVRQTVASNLESTQRLFAVVETRRQHELRAQAETLADNATLKAALDTYQAETRANRAVVRALTGWVHAATIAGAIFALYPYRYEHYSHLELEMTMWMPLALLGLHRALAGGRLRDGLAAGFAFALQTLSSLYYGCFLAVYLAVVGGALWLGRGRPRTPIGPLAAGIVLASVLVAPVAVAYIASRPVMGPRDEGTIQFYSAQGPDYLKPHFRSRLYGRWSEGGAPSARSFRG